MRSPDESRLSRTANPFLPGSWEPGRFRPSDALIIKVTLIAMGLWRGFDYLTSAGMAPGPAQESMQTAFPLYVWGVLVLVPTLLLAAGLALRVHFAIWLGHGLFAAVYAALLVSLMLVYIDRPLFDGIRSATVLLAPLVLHIVLCSRTGWKPPNWNMSNREEG